MPASGYEHGVALEWLAFANSTLLPKYGAVFTALFKLGLSKEDALKNPLVAAALDGIQKCWDDVEQQLADKPYLCGSDITVGDILTTVIANWTGNMPKPINFGPKTKAYLARVSARPAYRQALTDEKIEYKAAA
ncbi:MAG: glutathione S-transferase C-terminal domain-containing protein [Alphaproteobacteria bacterium]